MNDMMMWNRFRPKRFVMGVCGMVAMVAGHAALAQQAAAVRNAPPAVTTAPAAVPAARPVVADEETAKTSDSGGIKVHGHWKMVVHDPDGSLVKQIEFENSLVTPNQGDLSLAALLTGQAVPADWVIQLFAAGPICSTTSSSPNCQIVQNLNGPSAQILCVQNANPCVTGLTVTAVTLTSPTTSMGFQLTGNVPITNAVTITSVATYNAFCQGTIPTASAAPIAVTATPTGCSTSAPGVPPTGTSFSNNGFTNVNQTMSLTAGQLLTVVVTFSFGS
jgi:hypothetical protein